MTTYHIIVYIVMPVVFIALITVTGRLEKRLVWQYGDLGTQPPYPDVSGYAEQWTNQALQCGFILLGWAPDPRMPRLPPKLRLAGFAGKGLPGRGLLRQHF